MTIVRIPHPQGQAAPLNTRLSVRLVTADGKPVLAFKGFDLLGDYADLALSDDLSLELTPTAQLALPDGAATWYQFILRTPGRVERYQVQVPESPASVELADLVAAETIPPGEILAEILAPYLVARDEAQAAAAAAQGYAEDTGEDALATAADRVQTGLDALAASGSAATAASQAQTATIQAQTATTQAGLAEDSAEAAAGSAQTALTQAQAAAQQAGAAADSAQTASGQAGLASGYAETASTQAGLAAGSAQTASTQAGLAAGSAEAAAGSAGTALTQAQAAAEQAGLAAGSAQAAGVQAGIAAGHAQTAETQAGLAAGSAQTATTQAGLASGSAQTASTQAGLAAASAQAAAGSYDSFDDRYLGAHADEPLIDHDGDPLLPGALYFNTALGGLRVFDGAVWQAAYLPDSGWQPLILPTASLQVDATIAANNLVLTPGAPDLPVGVTVTVGAGACWLLVGSAPRGLEYDPATGAWDTIDLRAARALNDLAEVATPYPHDRELLEYDGAASRWVNRAPRAIATRLRPAALTQDLTQPADTLTLAVDGEALAPGRTLSLAPGACLAIASGDKTLLQYDAAQDSFEAVEGVLGAAVGTHGAQTLRDKTLIAPVLTQPTLARPVMTDVAVTGGQLSEVRAVFSFGLMHSQAVVGTQQIPAATHALSVMPISLPAGTAVEVGAQAIWTLLWPETLVAAFAS